MRKKRLGIISICLLLALFLEGCTSRQGTYTILSTKNVEISRVDLKQVDFQRNVTGSDGRFWLLFIPFGRAPNLQEAVDECLETGGGDFMTSAALYYTDWHVILFGWEDWTVEGDVGDSLSAGAANITR